MNVMAEVTASAARWPMVIPARHGPIILGVDELRTHLLEHGFSLFILDFLLSDEPFHQLNSLIVA